MTVAAKTELSKQYIDPRVKRTRKLLEQAFIELLDDKSFQDLTIQDITDRATVNRATFYAHFEDKYDMLDSFICQQFNEVLADKAPPAPIDSLERLQLIIVTVMEYIGHIHKHCVRSDQPVGPMFESAVQEELMKYLLDCFALTPPSLIPRGVSPQTAAKVWSWAVFGTAMQWAQAEPRASAVETAQEISKVLTAGCAAE